MKYWYEKFEVRKRAGIPHWHVPNGVYFVTFRLADSMPRSVVFRLAEMRTLLRKEGAKQFDSEEARRIEREIFRITEMDLDRHRGKCWLRNFDVATAVQSAIELKNGDTHQLVASALMPNHVHVVFVLREAELDELLREWKSVSAHNVNRLLCRSGGFWQSDYFDVLIRDSDQLQRTVAYVLNNPIKAGLVDWPHVHSWPEQIAKLL